MEIIFCLSYRGNERNNNKTNGGEKKSYHIGIGLLQA